MADVTKKCDDIKAALKTNAPIMTMQSLDPIFANNNRGAIFYIRAKGTMKPGGTFDKNSKALLDAYQTLKKEVQNEQKDIINMAQALGDDFNAVSRDLSDEESILDTLKNVAIDKDEVKTLQKKVEQYRKAYDELNAFLDSKTVDVPTSNDELYLYMKPYKEFGNACVKYGRAIWRHEFRPYKSQTSHYEDTLRSEVSDLVIELGKAIGKIPDDYAPPRKWK